MPRRRLLTSFCFFCTCLIFFSGTSFSACPQADLSGDCIVDITDLLLFADSWLSTDLPNHSGLIARWNLDESTGEIAADDIGGHDGLLHNNPQWMPLEGYIGGALFFDGVDDYVEISDYKGITGTASRTCTAWISTSQVSGEIITWGSQDGNGTRWIIRVNEGGQLRTEVSGGNIIGTTLIDDGEWHHIAVVMEDDGSPDIAEAKLYVDGIPEKISSSAGEPINTGTYQNMQFGVYESTQRYFEGKIDDIQIFNEALTGEDIFRLYQTGSALHHRPDFNADDTANIEDYAVLSQQWKTQAPQVIISEFMADNESDNPPITEQGQILDGDGQSSDWIEIYNQTDFPIDLGGWALSNDFANPLEWPFPAGTVIQGRSYLLVFASGQAEEDYPYFDASGYLHTSFNLSASGGYLSLARPDGTIEDDFSSVLGGYPEQDANISYGLLNGDEYYFALPTPEDENLETFFGYVDAPDFSHDRGYYDSSFSVVLTTQTQDAVIRYTMDGTPPTLSNGTTYAIPINLSSLEESKCIRAAAFKPGYESSKVKTKTYIFGATASMKSLPAVFLSGSPTYAFYNPNGVMAIVGGDYSGGVWYAITPSDYNNFLGHGKDYERPVSMEYIDSGLGFSFQEDCGVRVHGSEWMRPRYTLPSTDGTWSGTGKPGLRLYFRGSYGEKKLRQSILEQFPEVDDMDTIVLRAGHNDQTNPFIRDEMIRRLQYYMGYQASLGNFVNLYVNSVYKGYFNLCERIDEDFCQKYYDSNLEWDVVGWVVPGSIPSYLEARDGDTIAFKDFINYAQDNDLADPVHYNEVTRQLDLEGFIDYLILQCWGGNWDWPQNNWTATAERSPDRIWRFYVWDAEGCMDGNLSSERLDNLMSDSSDLSRLYQALYVNEDFRTLFSDRIQKHFLESDSVMRQEFLDSLFWQLAQEVQGVIPSISTWIPDTFIPYRTDYYFLDECISWGLFTFEGPQMYLDGREIYKHDEGLDNSLLSFQNAPGESGDIYFTLDGSDPRLSLSEQAQINSITLVPEDAPKRVLIPTSDIGTDWRTDINFDDSGWNAGLPVDPSKTGGVGYERDAVGNQQYISYDVETEMYKNESSAYVRIPFTVTADPAELGTWNFLTLSARYDDGFIAYINGIEVCRRSFNGTPEWDSSASSNHENDVMETIPINNFVSALQSGENILAIQGLNVNSNSTDFVISVILEGGQNSGLGNGISASAQLYTSPIALDKSAQVKVRALNGSTWSALREVDILIGHVRENLRVNELMYNPNGDPNEEFVELTNIGTDPINLNYAAFTDGIQYTFGDIVLHPGNFLLLVRNQSVFENRYGIGLPIAGEYEGALSNGGENICLRDVTDTVIQEFTYEDDWYDITDGQGFSLTIRDASSSDWTIKEGWRPSAITGGSPGVSDAGSLPDPGSIVINEILAHSHASNPDWIELHNTTDQLINIGGWFLSDSNADDPNIMKYEIPVGTSIDPNGYCVFYEDQHFGNSNAPGVNIPFALNEGGDAVYLHGGSGGTVTGYEESESFGASASNVALGRYIKSSLDGGVNFVPMSTNTPGDENAYPMVGPVVITEIMYHPGTGDTGNEYLELKNISGSPVTLQDLVSTETSPGVFENQTVQWRFSDGIDFIFPPNTTIPAGGYVIIAKDPAAFTDYHGAMLPGVEVLGPFLYDTSLSNGGERLQIVRPGDQEYGQGRYWIRTERVTYDDESPWPTSPDGDGDALHQKTPDTFGANYGNDVINWQAGAPSLPLAAVDHLQLHLAFDEMTGDVAGDSSAYNRPGQLINSPAWSTGYNGGALTFDTTNYVEVANDDGLNPDTDSWSVAFWMKSDTASQGALIVSKRQGTSPYPGYLIGLSNGSPTTFTPGSKLTFLLGTETGDRKGGYTIGDIAFNEWTHVCVILDQDADTAYIYIDGVPVQINVSPNDTLPAINTTTPLYIGKNPGVSSKPYDGLVDDVRIYNKALTAQEVSDISQ